MLQSSRAQYIWGNLFPLHSNIIRFLDKATGMYNILWKDGVADALVSAFLADFLSKFIKHTQTTSSSFEQKSICVAYSSFLLLVYVLLGFAVPNTYRCYS